MRATRLVGLAAASAAVAVALVAPSVASASPRPAAAPATAQASAPASSSGKLGTKPLSDTAAVFAKSFNTDWNDFNIVSHAVFAVLAAKPHSKVGVLADGKVALTAFLPTDRAFQSLVYQKTGQFIDDESKVFAAVAGLGIDTVEQVLLYHVVPGATLPAAKVLKADGARLRTAQGQRIKVWILDAKAPVIRLVDANRYNADPLVNIAQVDINAGNRQIAHGVSQVLLFRGA